MANVDERLFDEEFLRRLEQLHLIAKRIAVGQPAGARKSRGLGAGLEFADHRAYVPGDDIRFVDWPYYARMGKLLLRLFHEQSEAAVGIFVDCSGSMAPGGEAEKFNYARRAAAALAYVAMGAGQRTWIVPFGEELGRPLRAGRNRGQVVEVLERLSALEAGGTTRLRRCLDFFARRYELPGTAMVISDLLDCREELADALPLLRPGRSAVTVVHVQSAADSRPALAGPMMLEDAETGRGLSVAVTEAVAAGYRKAWGEMAQLYRRACVSRGVTYVAADTGRALEKLVLESLRRAGVLTG